MERKYEKANKLFLITGALLGWFALLTQLYLIIVNNPITVQEAVIRYFSYFTILTNIIVVLCFTLLLFNLNIKEGFFSNPKVLAAVTLYISVVGIVYNLILRFTWQPQGLQFFVDELLHAIIPVLFIIYWLIFVPKNTLNWSDTLAWLCYPFIYLLFVLLRGAMSGFYPYPFIDVNQLGYHKVMLNSFYMLIVFLTLSLLLVGIGKLMGNHRKRNKYLRY
jgi:hypothetical protein